MLLRIGNKKVAILIIILIILLILGGVFLWKIRQGGEEKIPPPTSDYEIIETPEGKIVENKKEKFRVKVPEGWMVKSYGTELDLFSPETEFNEQGGLSSQSVREGACGVAFEIKEHKSSRIEYLKELIEMVQKNPAEMEKDGYSIAIISDKVALEQVFKKDGEIRNIEVELPIGDKVYYFTSGIFFSKKCIEELEKTLQTVSIGI